MIRRGLGKWAGTDQPWKIIGADRAAGFFLIELNHPLTRSLTGAIPRDSISFCFPPSTADDTRCNNNVARTLFFVFALIPEPYLGA